ncbi:MAG: metallophosphoesterase family protein [Myxococcales bacterium]|nr:metallophosphoesterase family protein [Myxococcales bacterium]
MRATQKFDRPRFPTPDAIPRTRIELTGARFVLGVVADTHSVPNAAGVRHLADARPDAILHAGDIGATLEGHRDVLEMLSEIAPVHAVRGNIDTRAPDLPDFRLIDLESSVTGTPKLRLVLTHIALSGPRLITEVGRLATACGASLVVCGHSHVPFLGQDRGLVAFNPGSIGPRRFRLPILFGLIEVTEASVNARHVDAETGAYWRP